jgi:hypothetical protein
MKIEYRGYSIEAKAKWTDGIWVADIRFWRRGNKSAEAVNWANDVARHSGRPEAEAAALVLGKERVDLCVLRES